VSTGKNWDRTFLIIIYDEHGGFFDHRYPPAALPPSFGENEEGFTFTQLGVRVPAVLVSPFIEEGTIFHPSRLVDHTSVIRTICARFDLAPLTPRDASACDLSEVFGKNLRSDVPVIAPVDIPDEAMKTDLPLNDLQIDYLSLVATNRGITLPPLEIESHARSFLQSVAPTPPTRTAD
jgi:phospholipase C